MKKQFVPIFIAVATLAGFASSCKKETINSSSTEQKQAAAPSVELTAQGYLKFADIASFRATIESLKNKSDVELLQWEKQIGIQSLRNKYAVDTLKQIEEKNPIENVPYFGSIINKEGLFVIGDSVHKVTYDKEFIYAEKDTKVIPSTVETSYNNNVRVFNIERKTINIQQSSTTARSAVGVLGPLPVWTGDKIVYTPEVNNGRPERCKVTAFCSNYASYGVLGVKISGEAYRRGGFWGSKNWYGDEISSATIKGVATYHYANANHINEPFESSGSNQEEIRKTIYDYYTTPFYGTLYAEKIDVVINYKKASQNPLATFNYSFVK